jgi:hypothetical protein
MFRVDLAAGKPVPVNCPRGLFPHNDADDKGIFKHTHFLKEKDAWAQLSIKANEVFLAAHGSLVKAQHQLNEAEYFLSQANLARNNVKTNIAAQNNKQ